MAWPELRDLNTLRPVQAFLVIVVLVFALAQPSTEPRHRVGIGPFESAMQSGRCPFYGGRCQHSKFEAERSPQQSVAHISCRVRLEVVSRTQRFLCIVDRAGVST